MSDFTKFYDGYSKVIKEIKLARRWKYTVRRQFGFQHYHVTLFPDFTPGDEAIMEAFRRKWDIDLTGRIKFNTRVESEKYIATVRRALSRRGIKLELMEKDLAM